MHVNCLSFMVSTVDSLVGIPCFKCLLNKEVNPYYCKPESCEKLDFWLLGFLDDVKLPGYQPIQKPNENCCPKCGSTKVVKCGRSRCRGIMKQRFKCKVCGFTFRKGHFKQFKTPLKIIRYALELENEYSTRDISKLIQQKFGRRITHVTIGNWIHNDKLREEIRIVSPAAT